MIQPSGQDQSDKTLEFQQILRFQGKGKLK
jgi:hypothetical protein